jgi:hypothetical protein
MSKKTFVSYGDRVFWALSDAFAVWFAYLAEQVALSGAGDDRWLSQQARAWRVAADATDLGVTVKHGTVDQISQLRTIARAARDRAAQAGSISESTLREWIIVDDKPVHDGMSRLGHEVKVDRILDVADGFLELLDGTLHRTHQIRHGFSGQEVLLDEHFEGTAYARSWPLRTVWDSTIRASGIVRGSAVGALLIGSPVGHLSWDV